MSDPRDDDDITFLEESQEVGSPGPAADEPAPAPDTDEPTFADEAPGTARVGSGPPPGPAPSRSGVQRPSGRLGRPPSGSGLHQRKGPPPQGSPSGSGLLRRPTPTTPGRPSSGAHRVLKGPPTPGAPTPRPGQAGPPRRPSSSGELPAQSSGRRRPSASGSSSSSSSSVLGIKPGQRPGPPDLTPEEEQQALEALLARAQPVPHGDAFLGREVGPFKVEEFLELDRGERRYVATHAESRQRVLLRVFPLTGSWGEEFKRLADRGERACRVEHAHLERCVAAGRTKECFYVGLRPPLGPTLQELLAAGPLSEKEVALALEQVGRALQALHGRDLVHGHVSPAVIRRPQPDTYVLCEAGLARARPALAFLSAGGDVLGRPGFIAPETVDSGQQTRASDLYSLGCTGWALLSQRPPFVGDDEVQTLLDQLNLEVPPVQGTEKQPAPVALSVVIQKLAGYTPDVRYRDASEMVHDLKGLERGESPRPFPPPDRTDPMAGAPARLSSTFNLVVLVLLLLNVGAATVVLQTWLQARQIQLPDPLEGITIPLPKGGDPGQAPPPR